MSTLVSVLIPVYNREAIIADTLASALAQTHQNIEVIVVDNASTDNTWQVIQSFSRKDCRVKAYRNDTNIGPVRNWLLCVEKATGEYGKILWSDDLITKDFIEKTLDLFKEDVGFIYTGAKIFIGDNPLQAKTSYLLRNTGIYPSEVYIQKAIYDGGVPVSPGCAIFRMSDIRKNLWLNIPNKVNSDFSMHAIGNDLLLFLLTAKDYKSFGHIAEPLSFFRAHDGSISTSSKKSKLPLHYALAKAFFVENYYPKEKQNFAAQIQLLLWFFNDNKAYGLISVDDFFKAATNINKYFFFKNFIFKLAKIPKYILRKMLK